MKKGCVILTVLAISLGVYSAPAANLLQNPGFEAGNTGWFGSGVAPDTDPRLVIPGWTFWGTDGWVHSNSGTYIGTRAVLLWSDAPGLFQDIAVTAGTEYSFSVAALSPSSDSHGLHGWDGLLTVEWYDSMTPNEIGLIQRDEIGRFYGGLDIDVPIDPYNTWKIISGKVQAPVPAVCCGVFLHLVSNGGSSSGGVVSWDNVFAGTGSYCALNCMPGDVNGDGYVNFVDFAQIAEHWLKCNDVFNSNCH